MIKVGETQNMSYRYNPFTGELDYYETGSGGGAVDSVNGQTGTVVLDADDIDDTSTTNKFLTAAEITVIDNHIAATNNPHAVTKAQVGLSNVTDNAQYFPGGTDVALADGGTGASLTDPNADRIMFWDESANAVTWLTASTGLTLTGTNLTVRTASATQTGIVELATSAEVATGTDTARAVTPAGAAATYLALAGGTLTGSLSLVGLTASSNIEIDGTGNAFMILDRNASNNFAAFQFQTNNTTESTIGQYNVSNSNLFIQKDDADAGRRQMVVFKANDETVFNEEGGDHNFRVEGDTDPNTIFVDAANDKVGFGTTTPAEKLQVIGNFQVDDATTSTKGYRFRTTASALDIDAAGQDLYLSVYTGAGFTGTQRFYLRMGAEFAFVATCNNWEWKAGANIFGATSHLISPDSASVFNEQGADLDVRFEGDTDENLLITDASADRVGIGVAAPNSKLEVNGTIQADGLRLDVTPTAETPTPTHTITVSLNGTDYKIPCLVA